MSSYIGRYETQLHSILAESQLVFFTLKRQVMSPSYTSILHFSDKATRSVNSPSADKRIKTVLIIGAGLAGLAAAIGFAKSDYDVTVLEKTPELQEVVTSITTNI